MIQSSGVVDILFHHLGAAGIAIGVFMNGLGVPGLSEVLLPLAGVAARQGRLDLPVLFVVLIACQLAGVSLAYFIARKGGLPLVRRYGKYLMLSTRELDATERAFDRYGGRMIVVGSFTPGVQGYVGYIAGVANMNYGRFLVAAFIGKLVWVSGLLYLGWVLGRHLGLIDRSIEQIGVVVLLALVIGLILYLRKQSQNNTEPASEAKKETD